MHAPGLILAAPSSGSGKTLVTLGLLAHLRRRGIRVGSAKVGPDYIDPAFHAAATGRPCLNLDSWAMTPTTLGGLAQAAGQDADLVVCEGVMGLFDGADVTHGQSDGSTAEIAALTGWPVVLVIDARGMAGSAAAVLAGFARLRDKVKVAGVIFNQVSSDKHRRMIAAACAHACPEVALLGFMPRLEKLVVPSRHLGLVQACEHPDLPAFLAAAADAVGGHVDVAALQALARPAALSGSHPCPLPVLGGRIAVARDQAFAFAYAGVLEGWRRAGAEIRFFSPLDDQTPDGDAVYLPGGYPELFAGRLAANNRFLDGVRRVADRGGAVFGECGGFMVLGRSLQDKDGATHAMAGLLPLDTSFAQRRLHLGYRQAVLLADGPLGAAGQVFRGHEFHFATIAAEGPGQALFAVTDAGGAALGQAGWLAGRVAASFLHLIDAGT
ncbi:cobyrinate a,c-diamide synthase [Magnetospirillum sp. 64-120]|uniref:cobyrinate a,c-diamide synthase n=1 Tax=Magnetospirillum sp. 64-120 TaxID=1895778 RepID=UPI0009281394|nr:cobyrinate a,c-diamide synthase [Magnetospirillum sp. 64-120]OJX81814.1 MAG: cobyrinic acid a,c-diamide synthase [Magnetospirillum sp. 64-120]